MAEASLQYLALVARRPSLRLSRGLQAVTEQVHHLPPDTCHLTPVTWLPCHLVTCHLAPGEWRGGYEAPAGGHEEVSSGVQVSPILDT